MRRINLDEYRTAVSEEEQPSVTLGGVDYQLPVELPLSIVVAIKNEDMAGAVAGLFGERTEEVMSAGLSVQDLDRIARNCYGLTSGEARASAG